MFRVISYILLFLIPSPGMLTNSQLKSHREVPRQAERASAECSQPTAEQRENIRHAEKEKYTLRRVEFVGNVDTRDELLRRRIVSKMQEGDLFHRRDLMASLKNVSRLNTIYSVRIKDVVARLDKAEKAVDLRICFKEKRRGPVE